MPDSKSKRDSRDRSRVAANEDYEVQYLAEKLGVTMSEIRRAIEEVGNDRDDIEQLIGKNKKK